MHIDGCHVLRALRAVYFRIRASRLPKPAHIADIDPTRRPTAVPPATSLQDQRDRAFNDNARLRNTSVFGKCWDRRTVRWKPIPKQCAQQRRIDAIRESVLELSMPAVFRVSRHERDQLAYFRRFPCWRSYRWPVCRPDGPYSFAYVPGSCYAGLPWGCGANKVRKGMNSRALRHVVTLQHVI